MLLVTVCSSGPLESVHTAEVLLLVCCPFGFRLPVQHLPPVSSALAHWCSCAPWQDGVGWLLTDVVYVQGWGLCHAGHRVQCRPSGHMVSCTSVHRSEGAVAGRAAVVRGAAIDRAVLEKCVSGGWVAAALVSFGKEGCRACHLATQPSRPAGPGLPTFCLTGWVPTVLLARQDTECSEKGAGNAS